MNNIPTPEQQAQVAALLKAKGIQIPESQASIPRYPAGATLPLSADQLRIWSLHHLDPTNSAYNIPVAWQLQGILQAEALEKSLDTILSRHAILRTTFPKQAGTPQQRIAPTATTTLSRMDLTTWSESQRETTAQHLATELIKQPFDLATEPSIRMALIRLDQQTHYLVLILHQIVFDGPSGGLLQAELSKLYTALIANEEPVLPALSIQYADFAYWEQQRYQTEGWGQDQLDYWQQQLGPITPIALSQDRPYPPLETYQGAHASAQLSTDLTSALQRLAQHHQTTLFNVLLAAVNTWLHGFSKQQDILVFTSAAGRQQIELQSLIGLCAKQLPLRTQLHKGQTFESLIQQVCEVTEAAWANQAIPFAKLMEMIRPTVGYTHAALLQCLFVFQESASSVTELSDLTLQPWSIGQSTEKFALRLMMRLQQQQLNITLAYKKDLFDAETIGAFLTGLQAVLDKIVVQPQAPITDLLPVELPRQVETKTTPKSAQLGARNVLESELVQIWEDVFEQQSIGIQDDFFALGGHSLLAVRLLQQIETKTGHHLPLATLMQSPTIEALAVLLQQQSSTTKRSYAVLLQPAGIKTPLFLVPPAGCGAMRFATLASYLDTERPIYSFDPQGLDDDCTPHTSIEAMAAAYIQDIQKLQPEGPYLLGGACLGSHIALEMAQQLRRQGETMALLMLLDAGAPASGPSWYHEKIPRTTRTHRIMTHVQQGTLAKVLLSYVKARIQKVQDMWFLWRANKWHYRYLLRAHVRAQHRYVAKHYAGSTALFQSGQYAENPYSKERKESQHQTRWRSLLTGKLDYYQIPNIGHRDMLTKPHNLRVLAEQMQKSLLKAWQGRAARSQISSSNITQCHN